MTAIHAIRIARVYDDLEGISGARVLVDGVWPRGVSREGLQLDDWIREVAPSTALRKWFGHDPARWTEFRDRYRAELADNPEAVARCLDWCRAGPVALLFGAKDRDHNQAVVLRDHLRASLHGEMPS
ncbi:DUF488 domain-containing protein [Rhodovulum euryhalinum]|uniref:Uncharacterized protein YeaO (DUF488 family) n=1 Tax=Rhodovulum euryhalinum TaxID=35805 RepID=A0A4V2S9P7_9RHOB|nr:DUF488 family protein [Rhodovulum euryhalinum]TCO68710.1 uncharacterized protein YeaO (DUF488 family) [Rhodovulum euryhalinum]